jgi:hypothetical protein
MYLKDNYDCVQHTNSLKESPKEPVFKRQNTKVPEKAFSLQEPSLKRYQGFLQRYSVFIIIFYTFNN